MPTCPIVGAFYRPPAQALINVLSVGTPLTVVPEPDNQYDPNAHAVWLITEDIPENAHSRLEETLPSSGFSLERVLGETAWHLGYIPKALAAELKGSEKGEFNGTFSLSPAGKPQITF